MTVTRRLAAILAADREEISETGLLLALSGLAFTDKPMVRRPRDAHRSLFFVR